MQKSAEEYEHKGDSGNASEGKTSKKNPLTRRDTPGAPFAGSTKQAALAVVTAQYSPKGRMG